VSSRSGEASVNCYTPLYLTFTLLYIILVNCSVSLLDFCDAAALNLGTVFYLLKQVALSFVGTSCRMITAHTTVLCRWYNQKLIRVMSPLSGGDG